MLTQNGENKRNGGDGRERGEKERKDKLIESEDHESLRSMLQWNPFNILLLAAQVAAQETPQKHNAHTATPGHTRHNPALKAVMLPCWHRAWLSMSSRQGGSRSAGKARSLCKGGGGPNGAN
jgi:hypothetical protein